ncbi:S-layer homology domain-containing protein [Brevibacillus sp. TJ4]|uniref:S-layer homology domain-containing protein n=1 Tax=Brevibacillus sp. TJ4 TaxID=3234853 RepID=UPI0037CDD5F6
MKAVNDWLTRVLVVTVVMGALSFSAPGTSAASSTSEYTAYPEVGAVEFVLKQRLMWNYADGQFHGDQQISQAQFVSSLVAVLGVTETEPVPQIPDGHWAKTVYERAQKAGILNGVEINPNKLLNKEETALLVFNAWRPYRGEKNQGFTNTGALITWGWMQPAPQGQPKFREDLPVTRADAALILRYLWQDKLNLELGEKYALEFHKSLKVENGYLIGTVPKGDGLLRLRATFHSKENKYLNFGNGEYFKLKIEGLNNMAFTATNQLDSTNAVAYHYIKFPSLERTNFTRLFSRK